MKKPAVARRTILLLCVAAVAVFFLIPFVFKHRAGFRLLGPDLSELKYTEVTFKNGDLALAGMLFMPDTGAPRQAVVFIQGSGTSNRNNPWYLTVASRLQESGIAVLVPDKRGSVKSKGDWLTANFEDLAGDADAAVDYLKAQDKFKLSCVGVVGFSQGGWIAPVAAARDSSVDFIAGMSGPGVTTDEQLAHEIANEITGAGTYHFIGRLLAPIGASFVRRGTLWKAIGGFDPIPYWRRVDIPAFMAFGQGDKNLPVEESVARLQALHKANMSVRVYPNGGHGIVDRSTHRVQEAYLRDLVEFVTSQPCRP